MSIICTLDSSIKLNPNDLPKNVLNEIFSHLRIPNPQKKIAEREMLWGAKNLPDYIELWRYNGHNELILPRGFYRSLFDIFEDNHIEVSWSDRTVCYSRCHSNVELIPLRDYQSKAIEELAQHRQGIYSAPTGSGKTRVMLELIRTLKQRTLIICEKKDIAQQWIKVASESGFDVGSIKEGKWDVKDFTVALRQNFTNEKDPINYDWFAGWGMVIVDECHHLCSADTLIDLVQRFPARYRFGCSATPDSDQDLFPITQAVIGPVVHESSPEEIGEHLVIPSVRVVKTDFEFDYRPTVRAGNKVIRNNYNSMMGELENDLRRNAIIMGFALSHSERGHNCLVVSKRKEHLRYLEDTLYEILDGELGPKVFSLTGDNSKEYTNIAEDINFGQSGSILFSTLADEGTDIPILDRIFLAYPGRKLRGFEQSIGRIMRPHPKKRDAIVYDFRDANVSILNSQFRTRAQGIYHKKGYKVENINE